MDIYLDKLELHGFKSFPEKTVIKFHKGITAVIGPNGCGKSNLVDAVLWVLGEQRIKNLRGDNNEDLIFNGSSSKKPLGMTEVGSFFSNKGESVYIARRFFRTGESKYILNDKYCRNKDIQNALFNMQLGGRGYFIFEQGSIEKMVSLKPSERRILIEEAAGISQYLERKKETANKLIIAEQNLENLDILSADKENRLKELKNQVNYVQRYRKIKEERQDYLKTYLRKRFETYQTGFEKLKSQVEKLLNQETILVKDVTLAEKNLLDFEQNRWDIDNNLKINQRKIFEINRNLTACQGEIEKLEQRQEFINQKITEMKNADKNGQAEIQQLEQQLNQSQKIYKEIAEQLKKEKISCSDFKVHLVELNTRTKTREKDDSEIKEQLFIFRSRLSQTKNKIQDIDKKMIRVEYDISTKQKFFLELKEQINENDINEAKKILADKTKEYQAQAGMFQKEEKEYQAIVANTETLKSTLGKVENEVHNLISQKEKYQEIKKKIVGEEVTLSDIKHNGKVQDLIESERKYHKILENFYFDEMDSLILEINEEVLKSDASKFLLTRDKPISTPTNQEITKEEGFIAWIKDLFVLKNSKNDKGHLKNGVLVNNLTNALQIFSKYGADVVTLGSEIITSGGLFIRNREKAF